MNAPQPKANRVLEELGRLLRDPTRAVDEFTLRRFERECRAELEDAPTNVARAGLWATIGQVRFRREDYEGAEHALRNALHFDPLDAFLSMSLGATLIELGRLSEAREALSAALSRSHARETRLWTLANLAELHLRTGDPRAARGAMREAVHLADPTSAQDLALLAFQHAAIDAPHDAAEFFARSLCAERDIPRTDEPAIATIERLEPEWHRRLTRAKKLCAAIETVQTEESAVVDDPAPSARVTLTDEQARRFDAILDGPAP